MLEQIVQVISKTLQILGLQPKISKFSLKSLEQFFFTVGQNNFGNKILLLSEKLLKKTYLLVSKKIFFEIY